MLILSIIGFALIVLELTLYSNWQHNSGENNMMLFMRIVLLVLLPLLVFSNYDRYKKQRLAENESK